MASIQRIYTNNKNGIKTIKAYRLTFCIVHAAPIRIVIQLSARDYTEGDAQQCAGIAQNIETAYRQERELDRRTLETLDYYKDFKRRLGEKGVISLARELTIKELLDKYERANEGNWKPSTASNKNNSFKRLFTFFDPLQEVAEISDADAQRIRADLDRLIMLGELAEATATGFIRDIRSVWNWGAKNNLIETNPFNSIKRGSFENRDRLVYIEGETIKRILDACNDTEWRLFILLNYRLGLRVPSETNALKWNDINFKAGTITIHSPKTERYKGKETRIVPIFLDIMEALKEQAGFDEKLRESPFLFPTIRGKGQAITNRFKRILKRAGIEPWGKPFQNLRATAGTNINNKCGAQAENYWLGHSGETAKKHYIQIPPQVIEEAKQWRF